MAQHGVSHATTSAETSSLLSVGAEARRPSKPQYVQTKKQPLGESFRFIQIAVAVRECWHRRAQVLGTTRPQLYNGQPIRFSVIAPMSNTVFELMARAGGVWGAGWCGV